MARALTSYTSNTLAEDCSRQSSGQVAHGCAHRHAGLLPLVTVRAEHPRELLTNAAGRGGGVRVLEKCRELLPIFARPSRLFRPASTASEKHRASCPKFWLSGFFLRVGSCAPRKQGRRGQKLCVHESASTGRRTHGVGKMLGGSWVERDSGLRRHFHVFPPRDERASRSRPTRWCGR